ncbi:MAG: insulinase family protein [Ruminococcaceae bacterium]|nr:insulinase family protein [Oscillospiraceae bacterium]
MSNIKLTENLKLGEKLYEFTHSSGLKVQFIPKAGTYKKFAILSVGFGSVNTKFILPGKLQITTVPDGVAHFLEHKLFEQPEGNMLEKFNAAGARTNAATGFSKTYYYINCTDNFDKSFDMLLHFVTHPYITPENVEKEKGIICREIKMYEDNPEYVSSMNLFKLIYHNNPVKKEIAGSVKSVTDTTPSDLMLCYENFYVPSNMVLTVVGDLDVNRIYDAVCKNFDSIPLKEIPQKYFECEPDSVVGYRSEQKMDVSRPMFAIGYKNDPSVLKGDEYLIHGLAGNILCNMLFDKSSDFFEKMYEKGLIDYSFASDFELDRNYACASLSGESDDPEELLKYVNEYISETASKGIDKVSFTRIKRSLLGSDIRMLTFPESVGKLFSSMYLQGVHGFDYFNVYGKITESDIYNVLKNVYMKEPAMSVVKPL